MCKSQPSQCQYGGKGTISKVMSVAEIKKNSERKHNKCAFTHILVVKAVKSWLHMQQYAKMENISNQFSLNKTR
jgi:hypothetical protein